jgi:peptide/nickel transport system substrate-binding protein
MARMYHRLFLLLIATCPGFLLPACRPPAEDAAHVFQYNEQSGIASLDPAFAKNQSIMWAVHQLYSTLVEVDAQLRIQPGVAGSWTISDDRRRFTFRLRTDVYFHDDPVFPDGKGRRLVAADVLYSFQRLLDPRTASPGAWIFHHRIDSLHPFEAPDDSTFVLNLQRPFHPILGILSMQYCSIVPREAVEHYGRDFRRHPVGSGPFRLLAWQEGQALVMRRNPHYFETDSTGQRLPYLEGIKVRFFDSKATEFLEFTQGRLDFVNDIEPSFKDEVLTKTGELRKEWEGRILLQKHPYLNTEYFGILMDTLHPLLRQSPLRQQQVRRAINYGIDRRKLMLYLRNSIGTPAENGFVPRGLPGFERGAVQGYTFNPDSTRALLAAAGFPGGRNLPVIQLTTIPVYTDLAAFIASELLQVGIRVEVETVQKSVLLEQTARGEAAFFRGSWIADYPDAENFLGVFYGPHPAPPNYTRYRNAAFDRLYEQSLTETSDSVRYRLYRQMDQLMIADAPVVPLWYDMAIHLVHPRIRGFYPNALNLLELRRARKE